ncbi:hypothetical protein GPECTOR_14g196 [Gonium pectorale]|uniref:RmlD-like substrate binding domain-containing protein n=1 Tax=Gonium pectorale TaxID=33097 RepID=A0A150GNN7_GONPE|nr:hypothetical protein GPECTOR_14g196 [Gonium pectorale]|eukprot:KXZ50950.1 hypothetical protein GPECTOR_14g196 [Gonium pectorale]
MSSPRLNILITGGSGYTGQFLVHHLTREHQVHYTYGTRQLASAPDGVAAHQVDLATGEGLQPLFEQTTFHAVINCAAISQPAACEANPQAARAVNVPTHLVGLACCGSRRSAVWRPCWCDFSTDQADAVRGCSPTTFFSDEWRSPVYVRDLCGLVEGLVRGAAAGPAGDAGTAAAAAAGPGAGAGEAALVPRHRVYNAGGPERLSRADMARQVADVLGCGYGAIREAPSASVSRPVASPSDISMDVSRLTTQLGFRTTSFRQALTHIFAEAADGR